MMDEREASEALGSGTDPVGWSWSYLRHPAVLFLWLAGAALSAFLADRRPVPGSAPAAAVPTAPAVLRVQPRRDVPLRRGDDDEARAA